MQYYKFQSIYNFWISLNIKLFWPKPALLGIIFSNAIIGHLLIRYKWQHSIENAGLLLGWGRGSERNCTFSFGLYLYNTGAAKQSTADGFKVDHVGI